MEKDSHSIRSFICQAGVAVSHVTVLKAVSLENILIAVVKKHKLI